MRMLLDQANLERFVAPASPGRGREPYLVHRRGRQTVDEQPLANLLLLAARRPERREREAEQDHTDEQPPLSPAAREVTA